MLTVPLTSDFNMNLHARQNIETTGTKSIERAGKDEFAFSGVSRCVRKHGFVALIILMNGKALRRSGQRENFPDRS
jgi:hypothetical protein